MSTVTLLNAYLCLNLLIVVCWMIFSLLRLKPSFQLQLQYLALGLAVGFSCLQPFLPGESFTNTTLKIWAPDSNASVSTIAPLVEGTRISFSESVIASVPQQSTSVLGLILAALFLFGVYKLVKEINLLRKIRSTSYELKKFGKAHVLINESISLPFSFWMPGKYFTVLPVAFLSDKNDFKVSLCHEFQHHRQGDTLFIHLFIALRALCFLNPFVHLLSRIIEETQEMACDEAVLESNKVTSDNYISCLLRAAQTAVSKEDEPVCAAGLCFNQGRHILKRRIQMMNVGPKPIRRWVKICALVLTTTMLAATVSASRNLIQDKRISLNEAEILAKKASKGTDFPIVVNKEVLAQLNKYLGTPEGRDFMRTALRRKKQFNKILASVTEKYQTPDELNAIPIAESGYENLPARYSIKAAGLWMFIPGTARKFGMKVTDRKDERLNVRKETDAAHRYLLSNKNLFNDWLLAIFAYNAGEGAVSKGIKNYGTKDVWELSKFVKGDKDYMAKVMASIIIMKNPQVLDQ